MNGLPRNGDQVERDVVRLEGFSDVDLYARREKIFTRYVGGFYQRLRFFSGWPLLVAYFVTPWLTWNGTQAVLFDLPARKFQIFSMVLWPQDLWLLGWMLMIAAFALFTFTTMVGRLWCGYTCPQTIWTAVFMWVEQLTEGERHRRVRLDQAPWSMEKFLRRSAKHGLWLGWALLTGITFVGYFTPIRALSVDILTFSVDLTIGFWALFFAAATYVNAGWLREQVCIYMCPYARFQSAMFDADTLVVSYDAQRGEPRGSRKQRAETELGDCIDCQLCVQVCPTGIDIRDGLQYECIGCAQCIDACASVMQKMNYPPGLIRYSSTQELLGQPRRWLRGRLIGYACVLTFLVTAFVVALMARTPYSVDVLRDRGAMYRNLADGRVANDFQLIVMNKSHDDALFDLSLTGAVPEFEVASNSRLSIPSGTTENHALVVVAPSGYEAAFAEFTIELCRAEPGQNRTCISESGRFIGPGS